MHLFRQISLGLSLALLLAGVSCQTVKDLSQEFNPSKKPAQAAYEKAIEPYLAQGAVYQGPAVELLVTALPLSAKVRQAMATREAEAFGLGEKERAKKQADQQAALKRGLEVAISFYVPEKKWNDLAGPKPDWQLYLENAKGQRLSPVDRRLIKERSALREYLYPFWGPWSKLYRFRFALDGPDGRPMLDSADQSVSLLIVGAPGGTRLKLRFD